MEFFVKGLFCFVAVILVLVYIMLYISLGQRKKEKALFHKMIDDPSDTTVSDYIVALENLNSNLVYRFGTDPYDYNRRSEDRHRQAQGWNHIKTCQTISESKKKELKALYNKYGATAI